jgi:hypothetical protein
MSKLFGIAHLIIFSVITQGKGVAGGVGEWVFVGCMGNESENRQKFPFETNPKQIFLAKTNPLNSHPVTSATHRRE